MTEVEISIMSANSTSRPDEELRAALGKFEEHHGVKLTYTIYDWTVAWAEIMKIMLYKHGPVMSQIGTTWLGSLEATQALRPFSPLEINQLGGAGAYHDASWKSGVFLDTGRVIAIPWFADTYVLYYRKDILEKAGIDEGKAFATLEALAETIEKLQRFGVEVPFAMPTGIPSRANIHNIAGWVWSYGGEFISEDGKHLLFSDSKTRDGLRAYFSLSKCTPPAAQALSDVDCYTTFLEGNAAISLRNSSLLYTVRNTPAYADVLSRMGVAAMPGESFVGGSSFVIWNHIRSLEERVVIELLRTITSPDTQYAYFEQNGFLPARLDALKRIETLPFYGPVVETLQRGRSFRKIKLWGLVEERLMNAITEIWQALYAKENADIDAEIERVLGPMERRLQLTLSDT